MRTSTRTTAPVNPRARAAYIVFVLITLALVALGILLQLRADPSQPGAAMRDRQFAPAIILVAAISVGVTVVTVLCSAFVGFALSASQSRRRRAVFVGAPIVIAAATSISLSVLGAAASFTGMNVVTSAIALSLLATLPLSIWQAMTARDAVPREVEDAAKLDGCSSLQLFRLVVLPIVARALFAIAIFAAFLGWLVALPAVFGAMAFTAPLLAVPLLLFVVLSGVVAPKLTAAAPQR